MRWPRAASSRWPTRRTRISSGWSKAAPCRSIAQHARRDGKSLSYRVRLRGFDAVCRMVGQGVGVAVVPRAAAVRHGRSAGFRRLDLSDDWAARDLVLCVRGDLPAYAEELVAHALRGAGATRRGAPASVE